MDDTLLSVSIFYRLNFFIMKQLDLLAELE